MDVIVERPAALDVHKEQVTACVRVPGKGGARSEEVAQFRTTVQGLLTLHDWLAAHGVTQLAMEATGVYWKPVWAVLEDDFELLLVNARHVKQVPGRKTDVSDAAWLCQLLEAGLLRASSCRRSRSGRCATSPATARRRSPSASARPTGCTRRSRTPGSSSTASPPTSSALRPGDARRARRRHERPRDPGRPGARQAAQEAARAQGGARGRFDALHAVLIGAILAHLDFLDEQIDRLSEAIEEQLRPFAPAVELLRTIPGVETRTAQAIIAEIGVDMRIFPTDRHLASWAGQCPGNDQSAGKRRSGRTRKGSKWLDQALKDAAMAAVRTNDSYLQAQYQRLRPRIGHGRSLGAVKHTILCTCWHMLTTGELYRDLGGDYFRRRDPERQTRRLVAQLEALGHIVTLEEAA